VDSPPSFTPINHSSMKASMLEGAAISSPITLKYLPM
jgi:hypothetical protein